MRPLIVILIVLAMLGAAQAQLLFGVTTSATGGGSPTPPSCTGTIDLSTGCTQPMLGGL